MLLDSRFYCTLALGPLSHLSLFLDRMINHGGQGAVRRQWNVLLSGKSRASTNFEWIASMFICASAAAAVSTSHDDDDYSEHSPPLIARRIVQCEALLPYQRLGQTSYKANDAHFLPRQLSSRKSQLLHRQSRQGAFNEEREDVEMHDKYIIDFNTVLGEGVSFWFALLPICCGQIYYISF